MALRLYYILLFCTIELVYGDESIEVLPIIYSTIEETTITTARGEKIFSAYIENPININANIEVCADLPYNWIWKPEYGVLYITIYNNTQDLRSQTHGIASTANVIPSQQIAAPCLTVPRWSGGNLYISVQSNNYSPVFFYLRAKVIPVHRSTVNMAAVSSETAEDSRMEHDVSNLLPFIISKNAYKLPYRGTLLLQINLSLVPKVQTKVKTTLVALQGGSLAVYVCRGLPCTPDSTSVVCSSAYPSPIAGCSFMPQTQLGVLYVYVANDGGRFDPRVQAIVSEFRLSVYVQ